MAEEKTSEISEVSFIATNRIVKIIDWWGWTDIVAVRKLKGRFQTYNLMVSQYPHSPMLCCTLDTLFPTYMEQNFVTGFHGERKYPFIVKPLRQVVTLLTDSRIIYPDMLRVKHQHVEEDRVLYPVCHLRYVKDEEAVYQILTKSGGFSANSFYLWGRESIPEDYCAVCPVNETQNCARCRK